MPARLLVVDDEAVNLEIIAEYLDTEDCELTTAGEGGQALALLRNGGRPFDAVVLDRMMPGVDLANTAALLDLLDEADASSRP